MGKIFVITGPSGSGKTTIIKHLFATNQSKAINLVFSISYTSRPRRVSEVDGGDYFFITEGQFKDKIQKNEFVEYVIFDNHYYGTSFNYIRKCIQKNQNIILDIDIRGALKIKQLFPKYCYLICISAVQWVIEQRLRTRKSNSEKSIVARMKLFKNDYTQLPKEKFSLIIVNEQNELKNVSNKLITFLQVHGIQNLVTDSRKSKK